MDVGASRPYVARAMSFLLVLSAVLNALTGAFAGARVPEPGLHQQAPAQIAAAATPAAQQVAVAAPPVDVRLPAIARDRVFADTGTIPPASAPLETEKLIE